MRRLGAVVAFMLVTCPTDWRCDPSSCYGSEALTVLEATWARGGIVARGSQTSSTGNQQLRHTVERTWRGIPVPQVDLDGAISIGS